MDRTQPHQNGTFHPDGHLLTELQDEMTWANRELVAANDQLAELESRFADAAFHHLVNDQQLTTLTLQRDIDELELHIDHLYDLCNQARDRFTKMERAFAIARQYNIVAVIAVNLRNLLVAGPMEIRARPEVRKIINGIASALHAYCWKAPTDEMDVKIREALLELRTCLGEVDS
ncbi:MAG: hypothetical protein HQL37_12580 [Alphaproteobacteria bacterium]|nr:hypothetical protein [Alphaproteobacteria bacterium]